MSATTLSIAKPDWETYCHRVAEMIVQEQSPQRVMDVRAKLYELLSHCIPPTVVLKVRPSPAFSPSCTTGGADPWTYKLW